MPEPDWLTKARAEGRILSDRQVRSNMAATPTIPGLSGPPVNQPLNQFFELPYPPTVNTYWRSTIVKERAMFFISPRGRQYQKDVATIFKACRGRLMLGPLKFLAEFRPPDKRQRDLDNLLKSIIDALAKAGAYENDDQIQHIDVRFGRAMKGGISYVTLSSIGDAQ